MPPSAYSGIVCQFITCLVPRVVEAPGQEAKEDISATLGQQLQFVPVLVGVCLRVENDVQSRLRGVCCPARKHRQSSTYFKHHKIYENERISPYVFLRLSTGSILIPALRQRSARQLESTVLQQVRTSLLKGAALLRQKPVGLL